MTKRAFLFKMNWRLIPIKRTRKNEIINHYRAVIDQSMGNGNTEESAIDSLGSINSLCRLILKKEKKTIAMPIIATVLNVLGTVVAAVFLFAVMCLLLCLAGAVGYLAYIFIKNGFDTFMPTSHLLASNLMAALFKAGTCMIILSIVIVIAVIFKSFLKWAIKLFLFMLGKVRDSIYRAESTRLMKEAFKRETIN